MLEKAVFFSEYNNINITGETSKSCSSSTVSSVFFCDFYWHNPHFLEGCERLSIFFLQVII